MEISIFGKKLFSVKSRGDAVYESVVAEIASPKEKESKYLPDFYERRGGLDSISQYVEFSTTNGAAVLVPEGRVKGKGKKKEEKPKVEPKKKEVTPKGVYKLGLLNDKHYVLNTNEKYLDDQLTSFKEKLGMINAEEYDMRNGVDEIKSIIMRLENRRKYAEVKDAFEEFPYTNSTKIAEVINKHDNLQIGKIASFIADLPKEATDVMKKYEDATMKLCGKKPVYYIIADKKDFKKTENRKDPILLAQSPFGHVWQVLGAWDKEMMFLQEL